MLMHQKVPNLRYQVTSQAFEGESQVTKATTYGRRSLSCTHIVPI